MKTRINLIPPEARKKETKWALHPRGNWKLILLFMLPLIIWKLSATAILAKIKSNLHRIQREVGSYTQKIANLKVSVETDLKAKQNKIDTVKMTIAEKEKELSDFGVVTELYSGKGEFICALLKTVTESISDDVWLDELGFDKENDAFYLKGFAFSHAKIGIFLTKLNQFPHLKDLYMKHSQCPIGANDENKQNLIRFEADGKLVF